MAGLYLHIPFCASRCSYCGFYSTTHLDMRQQYVEAMCTEMQMRHNYLSASHTQQQQAHRAISTIYFGGGTPSQLTPEQLKKLFSAIGDTFFNGKIQTIEQTCEVTLECNPDDVTPQFAEFIKQTPINRISMGAQTFSDARLQFLHRRHKAEDVQRAVCLFRQAGIENISIDLMFGFPNETIYDWENDINQALSLDVEHVSAYSLMYEEDTTLFKLLQQGKIEEIDDELSRTMYDRLVNRLTAAGYEHYEISNFAKTDFRSKHNSSYWHAIPYLGIGTSAHSYDIRSRQWNVSSIKTYISSIKKGQLPFEREWLDDDTRYNDLITTALRTTEGIDMSTLKPKYKTYLLRQAEKQIAQNLMEIQGDHIRLTSKGLYVSDGVMADLIYA